MRTLLFLILTIDLFVGCNFDKNTQNQITRLDWDAKHMLIDDTSGFWQKATYEIQNRPNGGGGGYEVDFDTLPDYANRPEIKRELLDSLQAHEADGDMPGKTIYQNNDSGFVLFIKHVLDTATLLTSELFSIQDSLIQIFRSGQMFEPRGTSTYVYRYANKDTEHYLAFTIRLSFGSNGKLIGPAFQRLSYAGITTAFPGSAYVFRVAYRCEVSHLIVSNNKLNTAKGYKTVSHNHFPDKNCLYFKGEVKSKTQYWVNPSLAITSSPKYFKAKK